MRKLLQKLLAPLGQEVMVVEHDGQFSIQMPNSAFHNRVVRILSSVQLLDKVILDTPLFSYRLKQEQHNGQTTIRSWDLIHRKCMEGKKQSRKSHAQKHLSKREEQELLNLHLS